MLPDPERLATKDDLAVLATKDDLAVLGSTLHAEMADLRTEMADLRTELKTEIIELRLSVSNNIHDAFQARTRTLVLGLVVSVLLIALTNTLTVLAG